MATESFGQFFKACRARAGKGLREFCIGNGFDPGNISRLERGRLPAPQSSSKLQQYAEALEIKKGSDDWYEFHDLAAAERGRLPHDLLDDAELVSKLPAVFRTIRNQRPSAEELDRLIEMIRRA